MTEQLGELRLKVIDGKKAKGAKIKNPRIVPLGFLKI